MVITLILRMGNTVMVAQSRKVRCGMILDSYLIAVLLAEPWPINFLIPLANGMSNTLTLPSNMLWEAARFSITEAMDISAKLLNIAYKVSTHGARNPYLTL